MNIKPSRTIVGKTEVASFRERYYFNKNKDTITGFNKFKATPVIGFDSYDLYTTGKTTHIAEIKVRMNGFDEKGDPFIQCNKFDKLMEISSRTGAKAYYINFFNDGKVVVWDLSNHTKAKRYPQFCNSMTSVWDGMEEKLVMDLPISEAKVFTDYIIPTQEEINESFAEAGFFYAKWRDNIV